MPAASTVLFPPSAPNAVRMWLPLPLVIAGMSLPDQRRLLRAATASVRLMGAGAYPDVVCREGVSGYAKLGNALARSLALGQGVLVPTSEPTSPPPSPA